LDYLNTAIRHLSNSKRLLRLKAREKYCHAALELRLCLEALVYYQAEGISKHFGHENWKTWQPQRLINEMTEIDETSAQKVQFSIERTDGTWQSLGSTSPLTLEVIKGHYHYLGNFLHHSISGKALYEKAFDEQKIRALLVVLEEATMPSILRFNFSQNLTFDCIKCEQKIVRKVSLGANEAILDCPNPNCIASYKASIEGETFRIEPRMVALVCPKIDCAVPIEIWSRKAELGRRFKCSNCGSVSVLGAGLVFEA
jgi:transcription elongation factor Elf1